VVTSEACHNVDSSFLTEAVVGRTKFEKLVDELNLVVAKELSWFITEEPNWVVVVEEQWFEKEDWTHCLLF